MDQANTAELTAEETLKGSNYFTCERFHVRMQKASCIERQTVLETREGCRGCSQGEEIKKEIERAEISGTCKIEGCKRSVYARGICRIHYQRWRRGKQAQFGDFKRALPVDQEKEIKTEAAPFTLVLPIEKYPNLPEQIEAAAEANFRSPEHQVLAYILLGLAKDELLKMEADNQ